MRGTMFAIIDARRGQESMIRSRRLIISIALAMSLAACGGGSSGTTPTTSTAASSLSPTGIRGCAPECAAGGAEPGTIPAGEYTTQYFLDGKLTVTFDEPWQSTEDQGVEFSAWPSAAGSVNLHRVLFWSDILPVDPHGNVVTSIPNTSAGFLEWLRARPNVDVSDPQPATIGRDKLPAIVVEVAIAADADNEDPGARRKSVCRPSLGQVLATTCTALQLRRPSGSTCAMSDTAGRITSSRWRSRPKIMPS
jgi:hypothetical protein